jgi:hypothetical protein
MSGDESEEGEPMVVLEQLEPFDQSGDADSEWLCFHALGLTRDYYMEEIGS